MRSCALLGGVLDVVARHIKDALRRKLALVGAREPKGVKYLNRVLSGALDRVGVWSEACDDVVEISPDGGVQGKGDHYYERGEKLGLGEPLLLEQASKVKKGVAMINSASQDRSALAATTRVESRRKHAPAEGSETCSKRAIRHLDSHP